MSSNIGFRSVTSFIVKRSLVAALLAVSTGAKADMSAQVPPDPPQEIRSLMHPSYAGGSTGSYGSAGALASTAGRVASDHGDSGFQVAKLTAADSDSALVQGYALAVSDSALAVGLSNRLGDRGQVQLLEKVGSDWTGQLHEATLSPSEGQYTPFFGQTLDLSDDGATLVVGARAAAGIPGSVYVFERPDDGWISAGVVVTETAIFAPSGGAAGGLFGQSAAIDGDTIVVGAPGESGGAGAAYVYVKPDSGWVDAVGMEAVRLIGDDGLAGDGFGFVVAISGTDVVVGAPGAGGASGAVYVFQKPAGGWNDMVPIDQARLSASDGAADDSFGSSLSADGSTVVVGAPGDDEAAGSAYVFDRPVTGWADATDPAKLTPSGAEPGDRFGHSLDMSDGAVVVGAYGGEAGLGAAYVFVRPEAGWNGTNETATLLPRYSTGVRWFGWSVAIYGGTVLVAEPQTYHSYLYAEPDGGWTGALAYTQTIYSSARAPGDLLGYSVSLSGDTAIVAAYGRDDYTGAAVVYEPAASGWSDMTESAILVPSDSFFYEYGASVAVDGETAVAGAGFSLSENTYTGAAYLFQEPPAGWAGTVTDTVKLIPSDGADLDYFGYSVDVSGDTVVVGAIFHDVADHADQGEAYVFQIPAGGWLSTGAKMTETARLVASDGAPLDYFGWPVAVHGDTVVVGVWRHAERAGAVYVYERPEGGWSGTLTETARLTASDGQPGDLLGYFTAIENGTIVAGAILGDVDGALDQGSAYVFVKPGGGWTSATESARLLASDGSEGDWLGYDADISGNRIAVGAIGANVGDGAAQGAVYVFDRPPAGWAGTLAETTKIIAADGATLDEFGTSIAASGGRLLIGAPEQGAGRGAAYIFDVPPPMRVWLPHVER